MKCSNVHFVWRRLWWRHYALPMTLRDASFCRENKHDYANLLLVLGNIFARQ